MSNHKSHILFLIIFLLFGVSCRKNKFATRYDISGVYEVENVEMEFYSSGDILDSVISLNNLGTVSFYDNGSDSKNSFFVYFNQPNDYPLLLRNDLSSGSGFPQIFTFWNIAGSNTDRIAFTGFESAVYTVLKLNSRKLVLQYIQIEQSTNSIIYKEVVTLKAI